MINHKNREPLWVRQQLCEFLAAPAPENVDLIQSDVNLLESGIVDSFRIVALAMFFEETFGIALDFEEIDESDFSTLTTLTNLVLKLGG